MKSVSAVSELLQEQLQQLLIACDTGASLEVIAAMCSSSSSSSSSGSSSPNGELLINAAHSGDCVATGYNRGVTPLMMAARSGHLRVVSHLLACGAQVDAVDAEDWNALHYACFSGHARVAKLLADAGCSQDIITKFERATPIDFAVHRRFHRTLRDAFNMSAETITRLSSPLTIDQRRDIIAKARTKFISGVVMAKRPFLFRYVLEDEQRGAFLANLDELESNPDGAVATRAHKLGPVFDTVAERRVNLLFFPDKELADEYISESSAVILRASSISAMQHMVVEAV